MTDLAAIAELLVVLAQSQDRSVQELYGELGFYLGMPPKDIDTIALARAIQGEEAGQFGDKREELGEWIAHTALNRWEKPWWKRIDGTDCTFAARVERDWHGTALVSKDEVEPWAYRIAQRVLAERKTGGEDITRGALFGMSLDDLENNGWKDRARQMYVRSIISSENLYVQFWFLLGYPGPKERQTSE